METELVESLVELVEALPPSTSTADDILDAQEMLTKRLSVGPQTRASVFTLQVAAGVHRQEEGCALTQDWIRCPWNMTIAALRGSNHFDEESIKRVLVEGAQNLGFWMLADQDIECLTKLILGTPTPSPGVVGVIERFGIGSVLDVSNQLSDRIPSDRIHARRCGTNCGKIMDARCVYGLSVLVLSFLYGWYICYYKYASPGIPRLLYSSVILDSFGFGPFFARAAACSLGLLTFVQYRTMTRGLLTKLYPCIPNGKCSKWFESTKELHIFCGKAMALAACVHIIFHMIWTVPGITELSGTSDGRKLLNSDLGCANPEEKFRSLVGAYKVVKAMMRTLNLAHPLCPIEARVAHGTFYFGTTTGVSGCLLTLLFAVTMWTSLTRKDHHERFFYVHKMCIFLWPIGLFFHGGTQMLGSGVPMIVFASPAVFLYGFGLIIRLIRFYTQMRAATRDESSNTISAVVRIGDSGCEVENALTYIKIRKPRHLWTFHPGMYAFANMPEFSAWEWHPFTICSSEVSDTVDFIIEGVGDWTQSLTRECLACKDGRRSDLPLLLIDGPYMAPTQRALMEHVVVCVGAGVGITPFLSLLTTLISQLRSADAASVVTKEAHFFWMSRKPIDFLFAKVALAEMMADPAISRRIVLHLHCTSRECGENIPSQLFMQAVKRQSAADLAIFSEHLPFSSRGPNWWQRLRSDSTATTFFEVPTAWVHGTKDSVFWVSDLLAGDQGLPSSRIPVVLGRPNWRTELLAIGDVWCEEHVNIFICGGNAMVNTLQRVSAECNTLRATKGKKKQFSVRFERFD
eukprot:TRINITY_DN12084_c0_g1_i3.p1 TRINITY_DN12084_c0_g1~~TRINITY_DN12084_c0_g1_i3.p1  ORF type:complete len:801 (+),score=102.39 TRINITY_DN12084_c0_g1_i3:154-2556(+)